MNRTAANDRVYMLDVLHKLRVVSKLAWEHYEKNDRTALEMDILLAEAQIIKLKAELGLNRKETI